MSSSCSDVPTCMCTCTDSGIHRSYSGWAVFTQIYCIQFRVFEYFTHLNCTGTWLLDIMFIWTRSMSLSCYLWNWCFTIKTFERDVWSVRKWQRKRWAVKWSQSGSIYVYTVCSAGYSLSVNRGRSFSRLNYSYPVSGIALLWQSAPPMLAPLLLMDGRHTLWNHKLEWYYVTVVCFSLKRQRWCNVWHFLQLYNISHASMLSKVFFVMRVPLLHSVHNDFMANQIHSWLKRKKTRTVMLTD